MVTPEIRFNADLAAGRNREQAKALGICRRSEFLIGSEVLAGVIESDRLRELVVQARQSCRSC